MCCYKKCVANSTGSNTLPSNCMQAKQTWFAPCNSKVAFLYNFREAQMSYLTCFSLCHQAMTWFWGRADLSSHLALEVGPFLWDSCLCTVSPGSSSQLRCISCRSVLSHSSEDWAPALLPFVFCCRAVWGILATSGDCTLLSGRSGSVAMNYSYTKSL